MELKKQQKEPSLAQKYKEKFIFWVETSTSHGLPNIARTDRWIIRIIWTLCFLTSLAYCLSVIITSFIDFFKYPTTVSITKVNELPTAFPAITICNINPFNEQRAKTYLDQVRNDIDTFDCLFASSNNPNCSSTYLFMDYYLDKMKRVVANDIGMNVTLRDTYGFTIDDLSVTTVYGNKPYELERFYKTYSYEYGNCYTFNSGKMPNETILQTSSSGLKYGFIQELILKPANIETVYAYQHGLYLIVHNQSVPAFTLSTGIFIPAGSQAYVGVSRVFTNKLDGLYSNCIKDLTSKNPYSQKLFGYFKDLGVTNYDQKFCFTMCYQDKLVDACNCTDINTPTIRNARYCSNDEEIDCMSSFVSNYSDSDLNVLCENACLVDCNTIEYQLDVSMSSYPTLSYAKNLARAFPEFPKNDTELISYTKEASLKINVYYENLYFTLIEENAKTQVADLLGNLGGQLGLFIGISFLSLVEILELIIEFIFMAIEHKIFKKVTLVEQIIKN